MPSFPESYFGFNRQQRNGLLVLLSISALLLAVRLIYPAFIKPDAIVVSNLPLTEQSLDSALQRKHFPANREEKENSGITLFAFDPNLVSAIQLRQLGVKEKTAQALIHFRNKGFVFRQKEDLRKVYGISDKLYARLEPYIVIAAKPQAQAAEQAAMPEKQSAAASKPACKSLELNTADSAALVSLDGIGPAYASRILKYRNLLGGFIQVEQLKEVYGMNDALYEKLKPCVFVVNANIRKLNPAKDDFKTLNRHPYLSYEITRSIFEWRKKTSITALNFKDILNDPELYARLLPYLIFE